MAALAALAAATAGCGRESDPVVAPGCRAGPDAVLRALRTAPREVTLRGTTLSQCIRAATKAGDLTEVGSSFLGAVQKLADRAEKEKDPQALTELGYLVGAIRRGRVEEQGVSAELVRRLAGEAERADTSSAAYRRGERAGRKSG